MIISLKEGNAPEIFPRDCAYENARENVNLVSPEICVRISFVEFPVKRTRTQMLLLFLVKNIEIIFLVFIWVLHRHFNGHSG